MHSLIRSSANFISALCVSVREYFPVCSLCAMLSALCLLCSGCASVLVTSLHNENVQRRAQALQFRAGPDGAAMLVDLLNLDGYFGAWQQHPWAMAGATIADLGTAAAIGVAIDESRSSSAPLPASPSALPSSQPNDLSTGEGGDIQLIQVYGNGNTIGRP